MIKTRAIVLHRFSYSDSSLIVKALTEESGIVSFILKGAKRKDSPFRGALDPLSLAEVVYRESPQKADGSALQFIKEAALISWRENLRNDLMSQAVAQVMAEIVLKYAPQGVPLQDEFILLNSALDELNQQISPPDVFARWLLNTSDLWGYHLDLTTCSRCEKQLQDHAADFHPETGGLICKDCLGIESPRAKIQTLQGLWSLRHSTPFSDDQRIFVENALLAYLRNHIGFLKELHSIQWLQEIRKLCSPQMTSCKRKSEAKKYP